MLKVPIVSTDNMELFTGKDLLALEEQNPARSVYCRLPVNACAVFAVGYSYA